tara:strand:+ start:1200 stop:2843 length:1644 start_codon:yes stop_codon:yes gene_type:complete
LILIPKQKEIIVKKNSILKINLDKSILDRTSSNPLPSIDDLNISSTDNIELKEILDNIDKAKSDEKISGIYLHLSDLKSGMSSIEEIRNKLLDFKSTGKFIYSYSEVYSQLSYYLSSVSDSVFLNPKGMVEFNGFSAGVVFYKDLLEKIGLDIQVIRHGKFKSAVEPYMYNGMSDENREQIEKMLNSMSKVINEGVSQQRNISVKRINEIINNLELNSSKASKQLNFIDELKYEDEVIAFLENKSKNIIDFSDYMDVVYEKSVSQDKIAIIYATGPINSGKGSYNSIGSETTVKAIRQATKDEKVKAIVLRVNSPGGSALASDVILRELNLAKQKKKIIVSMGDYAASGGYYISCNADKIFANNTTLTGSIGVFGIVPNTQKLLNEKIGVYIDTVNTHKYSDLGNGYRKLTKYELDVIQNSVEDVYETFITHVSKGRGISVDEVDKIGQGRVWSGVDALEIGLVDEIGGLEEAIASAAELSDLDDYRIITLPNKKDEFEELIKKITVEKNILLKKMMSFSDVVLRNFKFINSEDKIQTILPYFIEIQ